VTLNIYPLDTELAMLFAVAGKGLLIADTFFDLESPTMMRLFASG
jgi:hypothetical protein